MSNDNQITDIDEFYELLQEVENGERKPFEAYVQLKAMESELKSLKSKFKGHVTEALMDYPDGDAPQALGHEITLQSRTKYKYKQCPQYQNIEDNRKALKEQIKMATEQNVSIADEETGEMIEPVEKTETTYPVVNQIKEES